MNLNPEDAMYRLQRDLLRWDFTGHDRRVREDLARHRADADAELEKDYEEYGRNG